MHWLTACRVASWVPASKAGRSSAHPGEAVAGLRGVPGRPVPLPGGEALGPGGPLLRPARDRRCRRSRAPRRGPRTSRPAGSPRISLVARISSSPKGSPCAAAVSVRWGDGQPMWLRSTRRVGCASGPSAGCVEGLADGGLEPVDVVGHLAEVAHPPAVGLEALGHVVVVGQLGRSVDRDVVVVVEGEQPPQAEMPGQRGRLVRDPLHEAAVARDHEGPVVAHLVAEGGPQPAFGDRHAHRVGEALAERPGGDLDARPCGGTRGGPASGCPTGGTGAGPRGRGRTR